MVKSLFIFILYIQYNLNQFEKIMNQELEKKPMRLTFEEKDKLLSAKNEDEWYKFCDEIKFKRSGQFPPYLAREVLDLYQSKFSNDLS
tara:strand:+ start:1584 stop:1847 length:264 start_codon:yes stop_codon:yes gene_type:complete